MTVESGVVRLLTEIGLMAAGNGFVREAEVIFEALATVRPQSEIPVIGAAVARLGAGRAEEAASLLRERALKINPASDSAKSMLGLALRLAGHAQESEAVLREVADTSEDAQAKSLAQALLAAS